MRLPADATLLVVGPADPAGWSAAARNVAALIEAWRREGLPAVEARGAEGAFDDGRLEARLDESGATTLVLCGEEQAAAHAARSAEALGFRVFVVRDACWKAGPAVEAQDLGEAGIPVDAAATLAAASLAKARQRRRERLGE